MLEGEIIQTAIEHYGLTAPPNWRLRTVRVAEVKHAVWWAYRVLTTKTLEEVGALLEGEAYDHSTVCNGLRKHEWRMRQRQHMAVSWGHRVRGVETAADLPTYLDPPPIDQSIWLDTGAGELVQIVEQRTPALDIRKVMSEWRAVGQSRDGTRIYLEQRCKTTT